MCFLLDVLRRNESWWMISFKLGYECVIFVIVASCKSDFRLYTFKKISRSSRRQRVFCFSFVGLPDLLRLGRCLAHTMTRVFVVVYFHGVCSRNERLFRSKVKLYVATAWLFDLHCVCIPLYNKVPISGCWIAHTLSALFKESLNY